MYISLSFIPAALLHTTYSRITRLRSTTETCDICKRCE